MEIRILKKQGLSIRGIARELGISRETVRKYLRAPDREPVCTPRAARPSKLDAHKAFIRKAGDRYGAAPPAGNGIAAGVARAWL
jgi:transposase